MHLKVYNDFGQLAHEYQAHSGAVDTGSTPNVGYAYANGSTNISAHDDDVSQRQNLLMCPSKRADQFSIHGAMNVGHDQSREKNYGYGTSGGIDDASSRIASFVDDDGTTQLAGYSYLGQSAIVEVAEPEPDLKYTLVGTQGGNDPDTGDIYRGLDRFGKGYPAIWI